VVGRFEGKGLFGLGLGAAGGAQRFSPLLSVSIACSCGATGLAFALYRLA
jgi:hypothetical protein